MRDTIVWTVTVRLCLSMTQCQTTVCDNTSSNSGVNGGMVTMLCEFFDQLIALNAAREHLLFGSVPSRTAPLADRCAHLWWLLWFLYKLFGKPTTAAADLHRIAKKLHLKLSTAPRPVSTRWLYDFLALRWARTYRPAVEAIINHLQDQVCFPLSVMTESVL